MALIEQLSGDAFSAFTLAKLVATGNNLSQR